jgi:predicted AAA+ superfamily ATPase
MKTIRSACKLQPNALEINVGDQIERLDQIIHDTNGQEYFEKTFITDGMKTLLSKGMKRLLESQTTPCSILNRPWVAV